MRRKRNRSFVERWLRDLLCGVLIGAGAILPGVSGGVLAVVFDIYRPLMETLTHPRAAIPRYWKWFIPLGLGWCLGFLGFAKGIAAAIRTMHVAEKDKITCIGPQLHFMIENGAIGSARTAVNIQNCRIDLRRIIILRFQYPAP